MKTSGKMTDSSTSSIIARHVGFVGLGDQGGPTVHRILRAGFELIVWARRRQALAAETLTILASMSDIVCICVPDDAAVIEIFDNILPALQPRRHSFAPPNYKSQNLP
jgi:3-hydroxyisobutyrate dehydrogenase-like beta-hydroxyacid dehydrogenase